MQTRATDLIPPQQIEAEQSLLGGLLLEGHRFIDICETVAEQDFYRDGHRMIFSCVKELALKSEPCDLVTVAESLQKRKQLEAAGGASYLAQLVESVPSAANAEAYAKIVREKAVLRRMIQISNENIAECYRAAKPVRDIVESVEKSVYSVAQGYASSSGNHRCTVLEGVKEYIALTEERVRSGKLIIGVSTGFMDLDRYISGLCPEEYVVIAARPSVGKTAFATALARNVAMQGVKVAFFSAEMGKRIIPRMVAQEARLNLMKIRSGQLSQSEQVSFLQASTRIAELPIEIFYNSSPTELEVKQSVRRSKPGLAIVDYIGYLRCSEGGDSTIKRERQISVISSCLKSISRDFGIPVVALSQLNREIEKAPRRPKLSDLRDSGSLEQDADIVIFLHCQAKEDGYREVFVEKNRDGACGHFRLAFLNESTEFKSYAD